MSATTNSPADTHAARPRRSTVPSATGAAAVAVVLLAAGLRLWSLKSVPGNVFYDAAVRSMGFSGHNLFFGALEPGGSLAVDKPPVDLWLQVASTRVIGFSLFSLHLPEALAGVVAVALLYHLVARLAGGGAALIGALTLAVLPISVLTARSDTMDTVMVALILGALTASWYALHAGRPRWVLVAAALMGLAFNVKLTESLVALPAIGLLWWWAAAPRRVRLLAAAAGVYVAVSLSWAAIASLTPASARPFPIGSKSGSLWHLLFVYNGTDRITGKGQLGYASSTVGGGPGPLRLFDTGASGYGANVGVVLLAALLVGALAAGLAVRARRQQASAGSPPRPSPTRAAERAMTAIGVWFATGLVVFSAMRRLEPRYLEAFAPAVAGVLGLGTARVLAEPGRVAAPALGGIAGVVAVYAGLVDQAIGAWTALGLAAGLLAAGAGIWLGRGRPGTRGPARAGGRGVLAGAVTAAVLAGPLGISLKLVADRRSDSALPDPASKKIDRYLLAHRGAARYEVVSGNVYDVMGIVARDGLPVLVLNQVNGPIVHLAQLQAHLARHDVRFLYVPHGCRPLSACPASTRWGILHSTRVAGEPGVYRFR